MSASAPPPQKTTTFHSSKTSKRSDGTTVSVVEVKKKTITFIGSIALLINNVTGGSMVTLPQVYQSSGWVLTTISLFGVAALSIVCGLMIIEVMTLVPGNNRFQKRLEYTNLAHIYFPRWLYWVAQIFYQLSILAQNVSMIIQSVQVMDFTLIALTGYSCAIPRFSPSFTFTCSYPGGYTTDGVNPFGNWYLISLGWLVTCVVVMPLGFIDLDDNDAVQKGGWIALLCIVFVWCGLSASQPGMPDYVVAFGGDYDSLMGTVLFNYAIVYTIPSWVNEKRPSVPIVKSLSVSVFTAAALFTILGYCGGAGFPPPSNSQTLLNQIYGLGTKISAVTFFLFPACVNLTSIPVNSIMQRYNLKEAGVCGPKWAAFLGVVLPWLIAIPLYTGDGYQTLVTWSGLVLISSVNFVFPPILYIIAIKKYGTGPGAIRTLHEEVQYTGNSMKDPQSSNNPTRTTRLRSRVADSQLEMATLADQESGVDGPVQSIRPGTGIGIATESRFGTPVPGAGTGLSSMLANDALGGGGGGGANLFTPIVADDSDASGAGGGVVGAVVGSGAPNDAILEVDEKSPGHSKHVSESQLSAKRDNPFVIQVQPDSARPTAGGEAGEASQDVSTGNQVHSMPAGEGGDSASSSARPTLVRDASQDPTALPVTPLTPKTQLPPLGKVVSLMKDSVEVPTAGAPSEAASSSPTQQPQDPQDPSIVSLDAASVVGSMAPRPVVMRATTSDYAMPPPPPSYDAATGAAARSASPDPLRSPAGELADDLDPDAEVAYDLEETEEERREREHHLRTLEKEEVRRQRTLKRLRRRRDKAAAAAANPDEVAKEHEVIQPLEMAPPNPREAPFQFAMWLLCLPWRVLFLLTVPHSATTARWSHHWYLTFGMICGWCVGISYFLVYTASVFSDITDFHPFAFGIFIVGFFMRSPNLLTEYRSFQNGTGDLNRIFSNSVWQVLICLPIPWIIYSASLNGGPVEIYTNASTILALTLFLVAALMLIMLKAHDWYMLRPVAIAAIAIVILLLLMEFLLDYSIIMDLTNTYC